MAGKHGKSPRLVKLIALVLMPGVLTGCLKQEFAQTTEQVPPSIFGTGAPAPPPQISTSLTPASVESAARVDQLGRKLLTCNPQIGLKPVFSAVADPRPEITHVKDPVGTSRVVITEGLVRECKSDGELAAVLGLELGKMVAQREALTALGTRKPDEELPPEIKIGNDMGGTFGPADGTYLAERAKYRPRGGRPKNTPPPLPPDPRTLARSYMQKAGFNPLDLEAVEPVLLEAERNLNWQKQFIAQNQPGAIPN